MDINKISLLLVSCLFLVNCSSENIDKDFDTPSNSKDIHLSRTLQRVVTYDCDGDVVSDQLATTDSPTKRVDIQPDSRFNIYHANYYNRTTGDTMRYDHNFHFYIDLSPSIFNMHVQRGINEIYYEFLYCDDYYTSVDGVRSCAHTPYVGESGSVFIDVRYTEYVNPGTRYSHPSRDSCLGDPLD